MDNTVLQVNDVTDLMAIVALIFAAFMVGMSIVIFFYYIQKKHKYMTHIALMSLSYLILASLVAGAMNFRVFYAGQSRLYASVLAVIACALGFAGLMLIFNRRRNDLARDLARSEFLNRLKEKGHLTDDAIKTVENDIGE